MKITHVVDSMEVGGAETLVLQMCRALREQGHEASVLAVNKLGDLGLKMQEEGFSVQAHIGKHLNDSARHFYQIFKATRPDVVHLHNPTPTIYAAAPARLAGVPSVISTRHSLVASPRSFAVEAKYGVAARFCDWIVGICDATSLNLKSLHTIPARRIVRIYNGSLPVNKNSGAARLPREGFTLVFVGRLEPVKNHRLLFSAFQIALSTLPSLRLWMVGDGSERAALTKLSQELRIEEQITFLGQQLDVAPFFLAADVFIMSSRSEGLPMSLLQAFSVGLPAIVTEVGGMSEVVRLSNAGIAVPASDPGAMATAILRMAQESELREQMSKNASNAFEAHFSLPQMLDSYLDLYRNTQRAKKLPAFD